MGIRVPPEPDPYADDCLTCYPPDKTPLFLYARINGVTIDEDWESGMPDPPNGTYQLQQSEVNPCFWIYRGDKWDLTYEASTVGPPPAGSNLSATWADDIAVIGFSGWIEGECLTAFENADRPPGWKQYSGGSGWVFELTL